MTGQDVELGESGDFRAELRSIELSWAETPRTSGCRLAAQIQSFPPRICGVNEEQSEPCLEFCEGEQEDKHSFDQGQHHVARRIWIDIT